MTDLSPVGDAETPLLSRGAPRVPPSRLGVAVVHDLVAAIVKGEVAPGEPLPPEAVLSQTFGVSRTVIRESVKRVEEKGLIAIEQGRGTHVRPPSSWNVLDPIVLSAMVENDDSLAVLDDLAVVRSSLEGSMAALTAGRRDAGELATLSGALAEMESALDDESAFNEADARFHLVVMAASGNTLADSITRILFSRARESRRFRGSSAEHELETTLHEHRLVHDAIAAGDATAAEVAMRDHISAAWARRRPS